MSFVRLMATNDNGCSNDCCTKYKENGLHIQNWVSFRMTPHGGLDESYWRNWTLFTMEMYFAIYCLILWCNCQQVPTLEDCQIQRRKSGWENWKLWCHIERGKACALSCIGSRKTDGFRWRTITTDPWRRRSCPSVHFPKEKKTVTDLVSLSSSFAWIVSLSQTTNMERSGKIKATFARLREKPKFRVLPIVIAYRI